MKLRRPATTFAGFATAAVCLALTAAVVANYPLAPWVLGVALVPYALAHLGATRADLGSKVSPR